MIAPTHKVLVVTETGDASRYWEAAIPLLGNNGVSATLLTLRGRGPFHEELDRVGIPTASLDCNSSLDYPRAVLRLSKAIRESGCDLNPRLGGDSRSLERVGNDTISHVATWQESCGDGRDQ